MASNTVPVHAYDYAPISERRTQEAVVRNLESLGYNVIQQCVDDPTQFKDISSCRTHDVFGIDVVAQKENELWIIEVKGKPRGGTASCSTIFMAGIGQISSRISRVAPRIRYSLAIPNSPFFSPTVKKFINSPILAKINLSILLLQYDGSFEFIK